MALLWVPIVFPWFCFGFIKFPIAFFWLLVVPSYSLPNGSYDFPPGPDPRCRPVEAWAGFLQFCVCARMRAPYICDGGWNLKNKISQELVFLWLPPVSNQSLSLSHGFPMISDGFRWFPIDCYRFPMASYGFRNVFLWFPLDCYNSVVFLWTSYGFQSVSYFSLVDSSGLLWSSPVFLQCRDGISHNAIHTRTHKLMHLVVPQQLAVWGSGG